jgi:hypothetical protein
VKLWVSSPAKISDAGYGSIAMVLLLAAFASLGMTMMRAATDAQLEAARRQVDHARLQVLSDSIVRNADLWLRGGLVSVDCKAKKLTVDDEAPQRLRDALHDGVLKLESCDPRALARAAAARAFGGDGVLTAPDACANEKVLEEVTVDTDGCAAGKAAVKVSAAYNDRRPIAAVAVAGPPPEVEKERDKASSLQLAVPPPAVADRTRGEASTRAALPLPPDALCAFFPPKILRKTVTFPAQRPACEWSPRAGSDPTRFTDAYFHGMKRQALPLPELQGQVVCSLHATFPRTPVRFDDELFWTWGDVLLMASAGDASASYLPPRGSGKRFDWSRLDGQRNWEGAAYCPPGGRCTADRGDHPLPMAWELPDAKVPLLLKDAVPELGLVITGDNNLDSDCAHDKLRIELEIGYLPRP